MKIIIGLLIAVFYIYLLNFIKICFNETLIHNVLHHHALHYAFNYIKFLIIKKLKRFKYYLCAIINVGILLSDLLREFVILNE